MIRYLGKRLIAYFYLIVYSEPSGLLRVSSLIVTPSYFLSSVIRATCGKVDNSYYSLNSGWLGRSRLRKKNLTSFFSIS